MYYITQDLHPAWRTAHPLSLRFVFASASGHPWRIRRRCCTHSSGCLVRAPAPAVHTPP